MGWTREQLTNRILATVLTIAVTGALDAYAVSIAGIEPGSGIAFLYPGVAFIIVFGIWFGVYGAAGAYIGTLLGGLATGMEPDVALVMKTANLIQALIPALAYGYFRARSDLSDRKSIAMYILVCVVVTNLAGATMWNLAEGHTLFGEEWRLWMLANMFVCVTLLPLIMLSFSQVIERSRLFVGGWR